MLPEITQDGDAGTSSGSTSGLPFTKAGREGENKGEEREGDRTGREENRRENNCGKEKTVIGGGRLGVK